ncbi:flagellar motor switch protein FliG [Acidiphilium sp. AL]|uniref:Flagellar motor switch protein FliG n=1 Tax=Acidiphilium iwatense TaxID=768198 RepID=A0ABS9DXU6_9PROT|nr:MULTISPECIES: flagellar motor switch protein FliG [Acidiphilium]MCF3947499.1 flagellar motor switch protein FliG [Acidiphilium iwatense]MCU4158552.1 flagellar motor switch protein FliG [Acidiphilium sp. AL]
MSDSIDHLHGAVRTAILMLALGEDQGGKLLALLKDDEIREVSRAMASLGTVRPETVEQLCADFAVRLNRTGSVAGSAEAAERLVRKTIPAERASQLLEDLHGPSGKTIWDKLGKVNESVLCDYLLQEHPQTAALVLSRVGAEHAARVIARFPESLALDIVERMLVMEGIQREAIDDVERTLKADFMANLASSSQRDPHQKLAEIFNAFDRGVEARLIAGLETRNQDAASRIKSLMFTFDDLTRLAPQDVQILLRAVEKEKLPLALKGASDKIRDLFLCNLSERAGKMLRDDIDALGPVRLRDVDAAQLAIVATAKELAAQGEIEIGSGKDDEFVI